MLKTRRIRLREVSPDDLPMLFAWRNRESFRFYVRSNDDVVDYTEFRREFEQFAAVRPYQFIVETIRHGEPIGFTYVHSLSEPESYCFLNIYISDEFIGRGYGVDVYVLLCHFLLTHVGIGRVYVEVFSYNTFSLSTVLGAQIPEEDTGNKKRHHGAEVYSVSRYYVTHEHIPRLKQWLETLCRPKDSSGGVQAV